MTCRNTLYSYIKKRIQIYKLATKPLKMISDFDLEKSRLKEQVINTQVHKCVMKERANHNGSLSSVVVYLGAMATVASTVSPQQDGSGFLGHFYACFFPLVWVSSRCPGFPYTIELPCDRLPTYPALHTKSAEMSFSFLVTCNEQAVQKMTD